MKTIESLLLIDDNGRVARLVELLLSKTTLKNVSFHSVLTLQDGLEYIKAEKTDLIFLDNHLSDYDRFEEPLSKIRKITKCHVVLFTGYSLNELGYDVVPDGLSGFLSKHDLSAESLDDLLIGLSESAHAQ